MTTSSPAIRTAARAAALLSATLLSTVLVASPAAGAPPSERPSDRASCVGQIFVPQATGKPRTVALRIQEIKDTQLLPGENFGDPISGVLARGTFCRAG